MEKEQPDSLATVAVGGKELQTTHSHYAPSEVYSTAEPPPAYIRPNTKSTAVQIARIAAVTLIGMSIVLGCFILASSYVQARASCTPEAIAAMQAEMRLQQHQQQAAESREEFLKHPRSEALVQGGVDDGDTAQSLAVESAATDGVSKEARPATKDTKIRKTDESGEKSSSKVNGGGTDNEEDYGDDDDDNDDDDDDDEFPPIHIKLPLQLDLDDIAGTLMQQARSRVSCIVERKRADQLSDGSENGLENSTDPQRFQRLSGERVAILCESGNPQQQRSPEQEFMTPIIVPLGTVQIPLQPREPNAYDHYQILNADGYQVPEMQRIPPSPSNDPRSRNEFDPAGSLPSFFRPLPQLPLEMRPPPPRAMPAEPGMMGLPPRPISEPGVMRPPAPPLSPLLLRPMQEPGTTGPRPFITDFTNVMGGRPEAPLPGMGAQIDARQRMPFEFRNFPADPMGAMQPPMQQHQQHQHQHQQLPLEHRQLISAMPEQPEQSSLRTVHMFRPEAPLSRPTPRFPPMPTMSHERPNEEAQNRYPQNQQMPPQERQSSPFQGIPIEIRRIIQQVPLEIKNIIRHITSDSAPRQEVVQEFKPFPEGVRSMSLGPFPLPIEIRNLLQHGNVEGRPQNQGEGSSEEQREESKPFPLPDNEREETDGDFPVPAEVRDIIHQVVEGRAFPVPRFPVPLKQQRPVNLDVPVEARAQVTEISDEQPEEEQQQQQQQQQQQRELRQPEDSPLVRDTPSQPQRDLEADMRPHYVQPRSVRSVRAVPEPFAHRREKRVRRCACDCAC